MLELDACTRCQECVAVCPIIPEGYTDGAMERILDWQQACKSESLIGRILKKDSDKTNFLLKISKSLSRCTTCGICAAVCESGIATTSLWESMRGACIEMGLIEKESNKRAEATIHNKNPYREEQKTRSNWIPSSTLITNKAETLLFAGCTISYRNPELGIAALHILAASGIPFTMLNNDEFCCGSYLFRTGFWKEYADSILMMIQKIQNMGVKEVLVPCSGCMKTIVVEWPVVYGSNLPFNVISFPYFIREKIKQNKIQFESFNDMRVIYHDPCHGGRHLMHLLGEDFVFNAPRDVISAIPGVNLLEFFKNRQFQSCCGAGGGLKSIDPILASNIARKKLDLMSQMRADILVSSCPFCEKNFNDAMGSEKSSYEVMDLIELVDRTMIRSSTE